MWSSVLDTLAFLIFILLYQISMVQGKFELRGRAKLWFLVYRNHHYITEKGECCDDCDKSSFTCNPYIKLAYAYGDSKKSMTTWTFAVTGRPDDRSKISMKFVDYRNIYKDSTNTKLNPLKIEIREPDWTNSSVPSKAIDDYRIHYKLDLMDHDVVHFASAHHGDHPLDTFYVTLHYFFPGSQTVVLHGIERKNFYTGKNQTTTMEVKYELICEPYYYGDYCRTYCKPKEGNFKCNEYGRLICTYGWKGKDCNIQTLEVLEKKAKAEQEKLELELAKKEEAKWRAMWEERDWKAALKEAEEEKKGKAEMTF